MNNNKDERYLNITLQNDEEEDDKIVFSFSAFFKKLKKYPPALDRNYRCCICSCFYRIFYFYS